MNRTMATARIHHYVPQCYLKNFCPTGSNQVFVVDAIVRKTFSASVANVAAERDFNRVEIEGVAPDAVEAAYGLFEGELGPALQRVISSRSFKDENDRILVLNLIGLTAVRNPRLRATFSRFQSDVFSKVLSLALSSREMWEAQVRKATTAGYMENVAKIDYETVKAQWENGGFSIETQNTAHVGNEVKVLDSVLPLLFERKWTVVHSTAESGGFITSDHPMCLVWSDPKNKGIYSPGLGVRGTDLLFPLSPGLLLLGRFEGKEDEMSADLVAVGCFNRTVAALAERQIYARDDNFVTVTAFPEPIRRGAEILDDPNFVRPRGKRQ